MAKKQAQEPAGLWGRIEPAIREYVKEVQTRKGALEDLEAEKAKLQAEIDRLQAEVNAGMAQVAAGAGRAALESKLVLSLGGCKLELEALEGRFARLEGQDIPAATRGIEEALRALSAAVLEAVQALRGQVAQEINQAADALGARVSQWPEEVSAACQAAGLPHDKASDIRRHCRLDLLMDNSLTRLGWHGAKNRFGH